MILFSNKKRNKYNDISINVIIDYIKNNMSNITFWEKEDLKNGNKFIAYKYKLSLKKVIENIRILKTENSYLNYNLFFTTNWEKRDNKFNLIEKSKIPDEKYIKRAFKRLTPMEFGTNLKNNVLPAFVSGVKRYGELPHPVYNNKPNCTIENIEEVSNLITIDIDHLNREKVEFIKQSLFESFNFIKIIFISPSGDGLKMVVEFNDLGEYFKDIKKIPYHILKSMWLNLNDQILKYINEELGLNIERDESADDVNRLCFLSYDPQIMYREVIDPFEFEFVEIYGKKFDNSLSLFEHISEEKTKMELSKFTYNNDLDKEITRIELFISNLKKYKLEPFGASNYKDYLMVGFAICDLFDNNIEYEQQAYNLFRRITELDSYYGNYRNSGESEIKRQFYLKWGLSRKEGITYGSLIKFMNEKENYIIDNLMN